MPNVSECVVAVHADQIDELGREFLGAALAQVHPKIREWRGSAVEADLREAQQDTLDSLIDEAAASEIAAQMPSLALPAQSFKSRLFDIGGKRLIAGINFKDASGAFPFIAILGATTAPGTLSDWSVLKPALAQAFADFRPRAILFFHPTHLALDAPTTGIDVHLLVAPARTMAELPPAVGLARVEVRRTMNVDFYPRYDALYQATYGERPQLRGEVHTETRESLVECLAEGLLFEIFVDGQWAGVVAADRRTVAGVPGIYMVEIVLAKETRGQRLGAAVHQRFAALVAEAEPAALILGTISAHNPWSQCTALRAGRLAIGAWHWIDL